MQVEERASLERAGERAPSDPRALTSILGDLWEKTELLMRQELALVSADLDRKVERAKTDLTAASISGATLFLGAAALVAAVIGLLTMWMAMWIAAGIVGLVLVAVNYVVLRRSTKDLAEMEKVPKAAPRSLQRTAYEIKEATR